MTMSENIKDKILKSADELFSKRGVRDVTIDDVCRHISISKKTFYQYYPQKEDLVAEVISYNLKKKIDHCTLLLKDKNPVEVMATILYEMEKKKLFASDKRIMGDVKKYYPNTLKEHASKRITVLKKTIQEYITKGVDEGYFKNNIDIETTIFLLAMTHKTMVNYIDGEMHIKGKKFANKRLSASFINMVQSSILSEKGWEEYNRFINNQKNK